MSYLTHIEASSLRLAAHVAHVVQGEDTALVLQEHDAATGGLTELVSIPAGQFIFEPVQPDFDGYQDTETAPQRQLTIAAHWLTASVTNKTLVMDWQNKRYRLTVEIAPESLQQLWVFAARPIERL